jgi:hypothetical protein
MSNHTAESLLAAVGVTVDDYPTRYCGLFTGDKYTGAALGTPELDAVLLVEGQRWLISGDVTFETLAQIARNVRGEAYTKTAMEALGYLLVLTHPGHALAAAIKEVAG